jgi:flagellar protein FliO/FliZ
METQQIFRFLFAFLFVLSLMGILALVMKRVNAVRGIAGAKKRLQVVEVLSLDSRRRLMILRRDNKEHLVILGTNGETVIEQGIESAHDVRHENLSVVPSKAGIKNP